MIAVTSLDSMIEHKESGKAGIQRLAILNHLRANPDLAMTRNELSRHFHYPIQSICGRIGELKKGGLVVEDAPRIDPITARKTKPVRLAPDLITGLQ